MFGSWVLNKIWIIDLSSSLVGMLMSPSKLFLFFEWSSFKLRCDTVIVTVLCFSHHACCLLYIWAKLTVVFTFTSFPFNLNTCVIGCGRGFGFKQKFWRIDGFGEIKARNGGFAYPYSPPSSQLKENPTQLFQHNICWFKITWLKKQFMVRMTVTGNGLF